MRTSGKRVLTSIWVGTLVILLAGPLAARASAATQQFRITPTGLDFGPVQVDTTSVARSTTVTNIGLAPVVANVTGGAPAVPFNGSQSCQGVTLDPGDSCQISYTFHPTAAGTFTAHSVGAVNGQAFDIAMSGEGVAPRFLFTPTGIDFGRVQVDTTSVTRSTTVTNVGLAPVVANVTGGAPAVPFNGSQSCQGVTLAPGASCQISYTFHPTAVGTFTAHSIGAVNGQPFDIAMSGEGVAPRFLFTPNALDFGPVAVGTTSATQSTTVTNIGLAPVVANVTGGAPAVPFNGSQSCQGVTLAPGASCLISYTFHPTAVGTFTAHSIGAVTGQPFDIAMSGIGYEPDTTPPTVTCDTPSPVFVLGQSPALVTATVSDAESGPAQTSVSAPADTSSTGAKTVPVTGYDNAGNSTTVSCPYVVGYDISIVAPPTRTSVNAGSTIVVAFRLSTAEGPVSDALASSLGCGVYVTFNDGAPVCAKYDLTDRFFRATVKTSSDLAVGGYPLTIHVTVDGTTLAMKTLTVNVTK